MVERHCAASESAASEAAPAAARRVLMISCAFPPTGGPGVQRSAKFAKYLPEFGWTPTVWSADHLPDLPRDESLVGELPSKLDVRRRPIRDPRPGWRKSFGSGAKRGGLGLGAALAWRADRWLTRLYTHMVPDHLAPWALGSYRACRRLIEREGIEAIYSTYSPASNHLLAWMLHRATGKPWIADFRDLWTDDYCYPFRGRFRERLDRRLESAFLNAADVVIGVTESQTAILRSRAPADGAKFLTITNGADPDDFAPIDRAAARAELHGPEERFVLTFTGWFLSDRVPGALIEGVTRFGQWVKQQRGAFEFRVVGAISEDMQRRFAEAGVTVRAPGYKPHAEAVREMVAADVLLLLSPDGPNGRTLLPGKMFEYLAAARPVLLVAPEGSCESATLLERCAAGVRVEAGAESICSALERLWSQWREGCLPPGCAPEHLAPLTRRNLTARLAGALTTVANARTSGR